MAWLLHGTAQQRAALLYMCRISKKQDEGRLYQEFVEARSSRCMVGERLVLEFVNYVVSEEVSTRADFLMLLRRLYLYVRLSLYLLSIHTCINSCVCTKTCVHMCYTHRESPCPRPEACLSTCCIDTRSASLNSCYIL